MSAPEGVAIIGSGIFVREHHMPAILANPGLSLKAIYSRRLASIASLCEGLAQKIDWYSDETAADGRGLTDMLENPNIKGVVIALPIVAQPDFIRTALRKGKHVLSEKPIAKDVETARSLIDWYRNSGEVDTQRTHWCVAENWRWYAEVQAARDALSSMGRLLGFRFRGQAMLSATNKWAETAWRKTPEHQGGFVLDMGVHFAAGLRQILGKDNVLEKVSCFSAQLQPHLAPVDTLDALMRTKNGVSGTFALSLGSTFGGAMGMTFAAENGTVTVGRGFCTVNPTEGSESTQRFPFGEADAEIGGVPEEINGWTQGLTGGEFPALSDPEEALADLEIIEAFLRSGEKDGSPMTLLYQ